ncbi:hypothetical protein AB0H49_04515 [Nocardia sp. NPDC050713]|uniref:hypothetical protein n=1 Tax=Nocardia sp. NPDC050713 TaxID=3154511 RepID=UPI0033D4C9DF
MFIRRAILIAVILWAIPLLAAPHGQTQPPSSGNGGCAQGGLMTGRSTPGTGSAGQNIHREATLRDCASPLLPGIYAGQFSVTIPWNAAGATSTATFTWSDGRVSTATGYGNGLWSITSGPASGHGIQFHMADTWIGWYFSYADATVISATFLP